MTPSRAAALWRPLTASIFVMGLSACAQTAPEPPKIEDPKVDTSLASMYAPIKDGDETIPGVDVSKMDPKNVRQVVDYKTGYPAGTIVVDPYSRFLYLVMENGKAMRYGVGVAKAGMEFEGEADISRKAQWPGWVPTQNMIQRDPERYGPLASGLEGGIKNPLGARALYLYQGARTRSIASTGPMSPGASASRSRPAASGC